MTRRVCPTCSNRTAFAIEITTPGAPVDIAMLVCACGGHAWVADAHVVGRDEALRMLGYGARRLVSAS